MLKNLIRYLTLGLGWLALMNPVWSQTPATLLILGDSLSTAFGLADPQQGWVYLLEQRAAPELRVINASISGETTQGGLQRLPRLLAEYEPQYVLIALGGNDGLQGHPVADIRARLQQMIELTVQAHAEPILAGIRLPPNYGPRYTEPFFAIFTELAHANALPHFIPFMLAALEQQPDFSAWMQADGIHPTAAAQPLMLETIWSGLPQSIQRLD